MNAELETATEAARSLVARLIPIETKLVLAESCTCGMAAGLLGGVAGVSAVFCGSAVTYRTAVKQAWLNVPETLMDQHSAESLEVSEAMQQAALDVTPEAGLAGAITGHLGPQAPPEKDGLVFVATGMRSGEVILRRYRLISAERQLRQLEAAAILLQQLSQTR